MKRQKPDKIYFGNSFAQDDYVGRSCKDCNLCPYIHLDYSKQLYLKKEVIEELFSTYASKNYTTLANIEKSLKKIGYRNTAKLSIQTHDQYTFINIGILKTGSKSIADLTNCPLHPEQTNTLLKLIAKTLKAHHHLVYNAYVNKGFIKKITLRTNNTHSQMLLVWHVIQLNDCKPEIKTISKALSKEFSKLRATFIQSESDDAILLTGKPYIYDQLLNIEIKISPRSPMLSSMSFLTTATRAILNLLTQSEVYSVLHLYCEAGAITVALAKENIKIKGIDKNTNWINNAKDNAAHNDLDMVFHAEDPLHYLQTAKGDPQCQQTTLLLTPPTIGLQPQEIEQLLALQFKRIIYLSLNPKSLLQDLKALHPHYICRFLQPIDFLPHTKRAAVLATIDFKGPQVGRSVGHPALPPF